MEAKHIKVKEPMINPLEAKDSRADFTYTPKVKQLIDAMYLPRFKNKDDFVLIDKVLKNYGG